MSILTKLPRLRYNELAFEGFEPQADFELKLAQSLMWISQLAYETDEPDKIKDILSKWQMTLLGGDDGVISVDIMTVLPIASTHAIVATGRGATIVAFAGTDPLVLANWVTDLNPHLGLAGSAEGYTLAAEAAWSRLVPLLQTVPSKHGELYVTGHSLGGALAVLTAHRFKAEQLADVKAVYTFGMPRPGSKDFATAYDQLGLGMRTYRLVYGDDFVPTVAPSSLNFRHVGRFLHSVRGGRFEKANLARDTSSDAPGFVEEAARELSRSLQKPLSQILSLGSRVKLAAMLGLGIGPASLRSDPVGIAIELLPPRLRDHVPDGYIQALS